MKFAAQIYAMPSHASDQNPDRIMEAAPVEAPADTKEVSTHYVSKDMTLAFFYRIVS